MSEHRSALYMACGLSAFLLMVVVLLNLIDSAPTRVSDEQFIKISEADLIESLVIEPDGFYWQLRRLVRIGGRRGEDLADRIVLLQADSLAVEQWRRAGKPIREGQGNWRYWGPLVVASLLAVGLWHGWAQIRLDARGEGAPRRRLQVLDRELKEGKITEEEFRERAERIWPEL